MTFLQYVGLYYVVGLLYFALVNHTQTAEEIDKPFVFYTVGLAFISTLWLPMAVLYVFSDKERYCKVCKRPTPKTENGFVCSYCTEEATNG